MKPEEQRIAIAEILGWTQITHNNYDHRTYRRELVGQTPNGVTNQTILPDYLNDLNAMHEAEKLIRSKLNKRNGQVYAYLYESELSNLTGGEPIYATAAQRAEAFLKTIGQWND